MPVVLGDTKHEGERFRFTLADDVVMVDSVQDLDEHLSSNPDEDLIVVGPEVSLNIAAAVAEEYRFKRPSLGVVLIRRRLEVTTMSEAISSGIREMVPADDAEALVAACKRSLAVSEQLRTMETGGDHAAKAKVILVFSSKGGCGKTTVATNLAVALSKGAEPQTVCLVDFDLESGDVAIALQLEPIRTVSDALGMKGGLDQRALASLVVPYAPLVDTLLAPIRPSDSEFVTAALASEIIRELSGMYDYVVIDAPPHFTDVILRCFDLADAYILLTTLDMPALKSLKVTLDTLDHLGLSRAKWQIVLNRGGSRVGLTAADVERTIGVPITVEIPSSVEVPAALNEGVTIIEKNPRHPVSRALMRLADQERQLAVTVKQPAVRRRSVFRRA
jgi:pilus assembly protein CpaE